MPADSITVVCSRCHTQLDENPHAPIGQRTPCPSCGGLSRKIGVHVSDSVPLHSRLNLKGRSPGQRRPFVEQTIGDDLHRRTGRWMKLERVIDRLKNWYREVITDPTTGNVAHKQEEPLSDHQAHGSARKHPEADV